MRMFDVGVLVGSLCLVGCVADEPPVDSSKQMGQLSGEEIWELCSWQYDRLGGYTHQYTCPDPDVTNEEDEPDATTFFWIESWDIDTCSTTLGGMAADGCPLTVGGFQGFIEFMLDHPCESVTVDDGQCSLTLFVDNPNDEGGSDDTDAEKPDSQRG